jgi:hypothetical protein
MWFYYTTWKGKLFEEMASKILINLSGDLPIASAAAGRNLNVSAPDPSFSLSAKAPKRTAETKEESSKRRKRAPLQTQVEALSTDALRAGIADSLDEVRTLPIKWAHRASYRNRQEMYASFSLFLMKQTGAALNSAFLATQFTAYQAFESLAEQPEPTGCLAWEGHTNWFSNDPHALTLLWKQAGVTPAAGTKEFGTLIAAWKRRRDYICDLLQSSTDWLKAAPSAPSELAAAALSAIRAADSKWPLFGEEWTYPAC